MSYIKAEDLRANFVKGFDVSDYLEDTDNQINDIAERLGIRDISEIKTNPLHYKIKEYGIYYTYMKIALDKMWTNSPDANYEKYSDINNQYSDKVKETFKELTYDMFTGNVDSIISRTGSSVSGFYRS